MNKLKKALLLIITFIFLFTFLFSAINLIYKLIEYHKANSLYDNIQDKYVETIATEHAYPIATNNNSIETTTSNKAPISINFSKLIEDNNEVVGWIYSQDTPINYPVVQSGNNTKYLYSDLSGNYLINGTIFVDYRNQEIGNDLNYIVYGHSMSNNSMFGSLLNYKKQSYYDTHQTIYYLTESKDYRIDLIAGIVVDSDELIYQTSPDIKSFENYINQTYSKSSFKSNIKYEIGDNIITLSTCSYEYDEARYVLIGKLVEL